MFAKIKALLSAPAFDASEFAERLRTAEEALMDGDLDFVAKLTQALARDTARRAGKKSAALASVRFLRGRLYLKMGSPPAALDEIRAAVEFAPCDEGEVRQQLNYQMNLGDLLAHEGLMEESVEVLSANVRARADCFGSDSVGYAYGAESLASVLLRREQFAEAKRFASRASELFAATQQPERAESARLIALLAILGETPEAKVFSELSQEERSRLAPRMASGGNPNVPQWIPLLWQVHRHLAAARDTSSARSCLATIANLSQKHARHESRRSALEQLVELEREGNPEDHAFALQGLALALDEIDELGQAESCYREALSLLGGASAESRARCLRNYGIFLSHRSRREEATASLRQALQLVAGTQCEEEGRVETALGIALHHGGNFEQACASLERATSVLSESHPDWLMAHAHWVFAAEAMPCDCSRGMRGAYSVAVRRVIERHVDSSLIASVTIPELGNKGNVTVQLTRPPTEAESASIKVAIGAAQKLMVDAYERGYGPSSAGGSSR